jgi:hypothetical protein
LRGPDPLKAWIAAEVRSLDDFLDKHSSIERELKKDPSLVNNADYLAKHPRTKGLS